MARGAADAGSPLFGCAERFPDDLRTWLNTSVLLRAASVSARTIDAATLHPVFSVSARRFHHPWRLLTLLAYAYACGMEKDDAIAAAANVDTHLRELCRRVAPSEDTLCRFRCRNRPANQPREEGRRQHAWCQQLQWWRTASAPSVLAGIRAGAKRRLQRARGAAATIEPVCFAN